MDDLPDVAIPDIDLSPTSVRGMVLLHCLSTRVLQCIMKLARQDCERCQNPLLDEEHTLCLSSAQHLFNLYFETALHFIASQDDILTEASESATHIIWDIGLGVGPIIADLDNPVWIRAWLLEHQSAVSSFTRLIQGLSMEAH